VGSLIEMTPSEPATTVPEDSPSIVGVGSKWP
jgi:hypothetical protein